jgi:hypothetical protein
MEVREGVPLVVLEDCLAAQPEGFQVLEAEAVVGITEAEAEAEALP